MTSSDTGATVPGAPDALDDDAVAIYRAVLQQPHLTPDELARRLGTTTETVVRAIESLKQMSLLKPSWDEQGALRPVNPEVGLAQLVADEQAEIVRRQQRLRALVEQIDDLAASYKQAVSVPSTFGVERLDGFDAVRGWLEGMTTRDVKSEGAAFVSNRLTAEALEAGKPNDAAMLARGVRLRNIYLDSALNDASTRQYLRWFVESGGEARMVPSLPIRMVIYDGEHVLLPIDASNPSSGAWHVTGESFLVPLVALFEHYWTFAHEVFPESRPESAESVTLTPLETELLRLYAAGHKDESVARRLGLSVRTVRRMVAEISEGLGANSRFEMGVLATRAGLI